MFSLCILLRNGGYYDAAAVYGSAEYGHSYGDAQSAYYGEGQSAYGDAASAYPPDGAASQYGDGASQYYDGQSGYYDAGASQYGTEAEAAPAPQHGGDYGTTDGGQSAAPEGGTVYGQSYGDGYTDVDPSAYGEQPATESEYAAGIQEG